MEDRVREWSMVLGALSGEAPKRQATQTTSNTPTELDDPNITDELRSRLQAATPTELADRSLKRSALRKLGRVQRNVARLPRGESAASTAFRDRLSSIPKPPE